MSVIDLTMGTDKDAADLQVAFRSPRLRTIEVSAAVGYGPTTLAAFDDALLRNGVGNFNLLRLSSVIPPETEVVPAKGRPDIPGDWGDKLYVVMAEQRVDCPGREGWAGIGWVQHEETGRGLFVEHEGNSERGVRDDIEKSLSALVRARPSTQFGPVQSVVVGGLCEGEPICAMAVAVYEAESWSIDLRGRD